MAAFRGSGRAPSGTHAFVCGVSGHRLTDFERSYISEMRPWGVILFARNVSNPQQLARLTDSIRDVLGWQAPVLIDQEGGRVQRLKPPHWRRYPSAGRFGAMEAAEPGAGVEAAQIAAWLIADDLLSVGIDVNCAPVLDLRVPGGTNAIGNRAYHRELEIVSRVGRAVHDAFLQAGVVPVIKHIPGHGRAKVDSHEKLPRITASPDALSQWDFAAFKSLADSPMAMTGHLVFDAYDQQNPVTLSSKMIHVIRDQIGFDGALLTDDLSMGALSGSIKDRAVGALEAGCDLLLHCNGGRREMDDLRGVVPELDGDAALRCARALTRRGRQAMDRRLMGDRLESLLAQFPDIDAEKSVDPTRETRIT